MYPFRLYGRIIQVYHYKAVYTEIQYNEELEEIEVEVTGYYPTEEEALLTGGTVTPVDNSDIDWMDGIEVDDVPDTYAEAIKIYEMGEEAYLEMINQPTVEERISILEETKADWDVLAAAYGEGVQEA